MDRLATGAGGYQVITQAWDSEPGDNFVARIRDALEQADCSLALISTAHLASPYCTDEWTGAFPLDRADRAGPTFPGSRP